MTDSRPRALATAGREVTAVYTALRADADPAHRAGWSDRLQQLVSFEILAGVGDLQDCTVLDAGCGAGDLYAFLRARGFRGRYTGIDLVPEAVAEAQARFPEATWIAGDLLTAPLEPHDYVLAAGLMDAETSQGGALVRALLERAFGLCRHAVAWNIFSTVTGPRHHVEPVDAALALCEALTPWFTLRRDYSPGHYTVYLYRREHFLTPAVLRLIGRVYLDAEFRARVKRAPEIVAREYGVTLRQLELLHAAL